MARGVSLGQLVLDLLNEIYHSTDPSQGQNQRGTFVRMLQRTQRELWLANDWEFLRFSRDIPLVAGQRYYDLPSDVTVEQINKVSRRWGNVFLDVDQGIGDDQYTAFPSDVTPSTGSFTITNGTSAAATGNVTVTAGTLGAGNQMTQITVNGVSLLTAPVLWGLSHTATAQAIAAAINLNTATTGVSALATGASIALTANADLGATANGYVVAATVGGTVTATVVNMASGADNKITAVTVDGLNILPAPVGYGSSLDVTAAAVAARINSGLTIPSYTASASSNQITISSNPNNVATADGLVLAATGSGTVTFGTPINMAGGALSYRSDPVQSYDIRFTGTHEQIEVHPVPATSNTSVLRIWARAPLLPFIADSDVCTLDQDVLVLMCAAEELAHKKDARASIIERKAERLMQRHKARSKGKQQPISFAPGGEGGSGTGRPRVSVAQVIRSS